MNSYKKSFLLFIISCNFIINVYSYGESDSNGNPIWQERESLNLMNAVRFDPVGYKNYFMSSGYNNMGNVFANNIYPATNPVYYNSVLNAQARYHSTDMGVNNCFSHSNCDGTSITSRFNSFNANCMTGWGENLSAGFSTGVLTQNSLICETPPNCVNDGNNDGHRSNMMVSRWVAAGAGFYYAPSSTYKYYWSQDYKDGTCEPQTSPIYSGSHSFWPSSSPMFHVSYYNKKGETLSSARVIFGSGSYGDLNLVIGSTNKGFYTFYPNGYAICDSYVFEFATTNGNVYRYPDTGSLSIVTYSGSCSAWTSNYVQGTVTQNPTQTPTQTPTPTPTPTQTPTPTPTQTQTQTQTQTPTPTQTQTITETPTQTITSTPTQSPNLNENSTSSSTLIENSSTNSDQNSDDSKGQSTSDKPTSSSNNSGTNIPGGINQNSQSEGSNSNQIFPNLIVPFLLGLLIKILLF
ncbi:hypothetical protein RB653_003170 [Dictyostelium firmibasis]|uniref:SCP domain-containing protein n=1 Tax=Dictyostelium firmibasis TaxID=79012 RepID=A0AAN7TXW5_9MYCE